MKRINRKAHRALCSIAAQWIQPNDDVLECDWGTGLLSQAMAGRCRSLTDADFAPKMPRKGRKTVRLFPSIVFCQADITVLDSADSCFDEVAAGNAIHLLGDPMKALLELNRACKTDGLLIIPTCMNCDRKGRISYSATAVGRTGADFKCKFTVGTCRGSECRIQ
ncbi:MAG: class I SAM-dependent methyltransferase [Clostridia bacterium]|nr:class I SAM-dependent methyltransferase [Clostridia bacterium]